jgi:amino acid transporter
MSINHLFFVSYWFSQPDTAYGWVRLVWFGVFIGLIIFGLAALALRRVQKERYLKYILGRVAALGVTIGGLGLIWVLFRQYRVFFLAWRFWVLLLFLIFISWIYRISHYLIKRVPTIKAEHEHRAIQEKYLSTKS